MVWRRLVGSLSAYFQTVDVWYTVVSPQRLTLNAGCAQIVVLHLGRDKVCLPNTEDKQARQWQYLYPLT